MKKILIIILLTGRIFCALGQNTFKDSSLTSLTKLDVGLQGVGFSYEPRISNKMTIDLAAGAGGGYNIFEGGVGYTWNLFTTCLILYGNT